MRFIKDALEDKPQKGPYEIRRFILMGDSLSDMGTLANIKLLGCIPMSYLSGLQGYSPKGRFTNGLVWNDHIASSITSDFTIRRVAKQWGMDDTDISDAVINKDRRINNLIYNSYNLDDDEFIHYRGKVWLRSYCVGGLTAHNYKWSFDIHPKRFFYRLIAEVLSNKREAIVNYDKKHALSHEDKEESLIIEFSGANDLITAHASPSKNASNKAIKARVENVKQLISAGYRHFVLFNLPNLSLAPRFKEKSQKEELHVSKCSEYFNARLQAACKQLNEDYAYCEIRVYDVDAVFSNIYHHSAQYGFDPDKRTIAYKESSDFKTPRHQLSPATGYMFYDDVHPSADMHALLASLFYQDLLKHYVLLEPDKPASLKKVCCEADLVACFKKHYAIQAKKERHRFFSLHGKPVDPIDNIDSLEDIFKRAQLKHCKMTHHILKNLGWLTREGDSVFEGYLPNQSRFRNGVCIKNIKNPMADKNRLALEI